MLSRFIVKMATSHNGDRLKRWQKAESKRRHLSVDCDCVCVDLNDVPVSVTVTVHLRNRKFHPRNVWTEPKQGRGTDALGGTVLPTVLQTYSLIHSASTQHSFVTLDSQFYRTGATEHA